MIPLLIRLRDEESVALGVLGALAIVAFKVATGDRITEADVLHILAPFGVGVLARRRP